MADTKHKLLIDQSGSQNFYCNLVIDGTEIPARNIAYLVIREWVLQQSPVPRLELSLFDDGILTEINTPVYNTLVTIELGRNKDDDNNLVMSFDIYDYCIEKMGNINMNMIHMTGLLSMEKPFDIPLMAEVYENKSSDQVIEKIGKKLLKPIYTSHKAKISISGSDTVTWIQTHTSNYGFFKDMIERAYISQTDCPLIYMDLLGNIHYHSLKNSFNAASLYTAFFDVQMATSLSKTEMAALSVQKGYTEADADNIWYGALNFKDYSGTMRNMSGFTFTKGDFDREKTEYLTTSVANNLTNTDDDIYKKSMTNNTRFYYTGPNSINKAPGMEDAKWIRQNLVNQIFSQSVIIETNPYNKAMLLDNITLKVPADINLTQTSGNLNDRLTGTYMIGGITHVVTDAGKGGAYKKSLSLFRSGLNKVGFSGV